MFPDWPLAFAGDVRNPIAGTKVTWEKWAVHGEFAMTINFDPDKRVRSVFFQNGKEPNPTCYIAPPTQKELDDNVWLRKQQVEASPGVVLLKKELDWPEIRSLWFDRYLRSALYAVSPDPYAVDAVEQAIDFFVANHEEVLGIYVEDGGKYIVLTLTGEREARCRWCPVLRQGDTMVTDLYYF